MLGVVAELELGRPIFPGRTELEEIDLICKVLGTPNEESWSDIKSFPQYKSLFENLPKYNSSLEQCYVNRLSDQTIKFLERILVPDPNKRFSAKSCIESSYFGTFPLPPIDPKDLEPLKLNSGMFFLIFRLS